MPVIFFDNPNVDFFDAMKAQLKPCETKNLRLMLWAGDGMHDGVTDVSRLPGYDVYLCAGWQKNLQANIDALNDQQTLCVLNIHGEKQLAMFHYVYDGCFQSIDSDYQGNTPSLPLTDYTRLLAVGGTARDIEGINSLMMPYENLYGMLELFAPALPDMLSMKRRWCSAIMELAKRDDLHPSMVWSSPDLNHPYYVYVKEEQKTFEQQQKMRCAAWPNSEPTLRSHWSKMSIKALTCSTRMTAPIGEGVIEALMPHMSRFDEFLGGKIDELLTIKTNSFKMDHADYTNQTTILGEDILRVVNFKQTILKMLMTSVPAGMTAYIGLYDDARYPNSRRKFGLTLRKESLG
jgi:hypothetical protein